MQLKVILTGATGMVGEGVLLECLRNPAVDTVLMVNRRHVDLEHPKLSELIVKDFFSLDEFAKELTGYNTCFFCAGVSSIGMKEEKFRYLTYDTTTAFAKTVLSVNPGMVFNYISGSHTDSSEKGSVMWARVKGKTENDLMKMGFSKAYNLRPGFMKPVKGQRNIKGIYKVIIPLYPLLKLIMPNQGNTVEQLARTMIRVSATGYEKQVLEVRDIVSLGSGDVEA